MTNEKEHFEIAVDNQQITKTLAESRQSVVDSEKTAEQIGSNLQAMVVNTTKAVNDFGGALDVFSKKVIDLMTAINKGVDPEAELKAALKDYQTYTDKRNAIEEKFNKQITLFKSKNADGKYDPQIKKAEAAKAKELSKAKLEDLKGGADFGQLFGNIDNMTSKSMKMLRNNIKKVVAEGVKGLSDEDAKAVQDKLNKLELNISSRNPGTGMSDFFSQMSAATKAIRAAKKELKEAPEGSPAEEDAKKKLYAARQAREEALTTGEKSMKATAADGKMAVGAANDILGMMGDFGLKVPDSIKDAVAGVGQVMDGISSIDLSNPMSIITGAIKVAGGLVKTISSLFSGDAGDEKKIKEKQAQIDALKVSYAALDGAITKAYSADASQLIEQQNTMLENQKVLIQSQIATEKDKKKTDDSRIAAWEQEMKTIDATLAANKVKAIDALFGGDLKSAIEGFANAYADAWTKGEDRSKSAKDTVRKMMRDMVTESIKAAVQSSDAMEKIRLKLQEFYSDKKLSAWEQEQVYEMSKKLQEELDSQFGWADSLMSDEKPKADREAAAKGIAAASQESVDMNNSYLASIYLHTFDLSEDMKMLKPDISSMATSMSSIRDNAAEQLLALHSIRDNTAPLVEMKAEIGAMRADMNSIVMHGVKIR